MGSDLVRVLHFMLQDCSALPLVSFLQICQVHCLLALGPGLPKAQILARPAPVCLQASRSEDHVLVHVRKQSCELLPHDSVCHAIYWGLKWPLYLFAVCFCRTWTLGQQRFHGKKEKLKWVRPQWPKAEREEMEVKGRHRGGACTRKLGSIIGSKDKLGDRAFM